MKKTPLTDQHIALGAKMAEFAGYYMPISYTGIKEEHEAVRTNAGIFDVSHMGEFIIKGPGAFDLVQSITSNDVSKLEIGEAQYSCMPNDKGGIIDDLLVYRLAEDMVDAGEKAYMLVVNASNIDKDWNWIEKHNRFGARMINISYETGLVAVQGPKVAEILQELTDVDLKSIPYYNFKKGKFAGVDNVIISATGYTGAGGFELYAENRGIDKIWAEILRIGSPKGLLPVGLGARDTLRLEMAFCLYGNDIDDTTSPLEAGLAWITKLDKGVDFTSSDIFKAQKKAGLNRKLCGFVVEDRRVPRHGYQVHDGEGNPIGVVTSGTQSPSLNIPIGLAYVSPAFAKEGMMLQINMGSKLVPAKVVKLPFYKK
jgi:aminomethyltransferase